jgi:predicted transporter
MSEQVNYTEQFENLPLVVKILLLIFLGGLVSGIYRILRYLETKNTTTLIIAILCFVCIGGIIAIIDIVTELTNGRVTVLAE